MYKFVKLIKNWSNYFKTNKIYVYILILNLEIKKII